MFKSGFETPQSQSQLIASASPRVLIFSALGRRGVGSISLEVLVFELLLLLLLLSRFSHVRLCDPIDGSPPGSAVPGILQARTLEWVAISFSIA